jgi:ABC-type glycerol-3-phosphate transport system substrate-binding protein
MSFVCPGSTGDDDYRFPIDSFNQKHPNITVEFSPAGTGYTPAYNDKLTSLIAGGTPPEVFKTQGGTFGQLAEVGAYRELDAYIRKHSADVRLNDIFTPHVDSGKYKGKTYSISHNGAPTAMWINVDLLQRAGLQLPSWNSTWDDLLRMGQALTRRPSGGEAEQIGFAMPPYLSWIWGNGGDVYSADGKKMLLDQPAALEAIAWLQDAVHKHRVIPNKEEQANASLSNFMNGRIGMAFGARGALGNYRNITGFTFDAAPLPRGPKARVGTLGAGYTSIAAGAKTPDQAFTFLNYFCSADGQRLAIANGAAHPSRKSLTEEKWFKEFKTERSLSERINTVFPETLNRNEARVRAAHPREADIFRVVDAHMNTLNGSPRPPREIAQDVIAETSSMMVR